MIPVMNVSTTTLTQLGDNILDYSNKIVSSVLDNIDMTIPKVVSDAVSGYDIAAALTSYGISIDNLPPMDKWLGLPKGLNYADFIERELELLNTLLNKTALIHHLEPSYFQAYRNAMRMND